MTLDEIEFDDDHIEDQNQEPEQDEQEESPVVHYEDSEEDDRDYMTKHLADKGIKDGKIKIINEDGETEYVDFNELSDEERGDVMRSVEPDVESELDDDEIELLNEIRSSGMSVKDYFKSLQQPQPEPEYQYRIDELTDDEVYMVFLKNSMPGLTDDEIIEDVEAAKQNEDKFLRKVQSLRDQYAHEEKLQIEYENEVRQQEYQRQLEDAQNQIIEVATANTSMHGFDLDRDEVENVVDSLLELDDNGVSPFFKMLNNPEVLYKAAWYVMYGDTAIESLHNYYRGEIKKRSPKPTREQPRQTYIKSNTSKPKSIDDLDYGH